jgi:hypothetical protein
MLSHLTAFAGRENRILEAIAMSNLTSKDKMYLEKILQMGSGYVLDFSDRTMGEFFLDSVGISIYADEYDYDSGSKANRMRGFWRVADDELVSRALTELVDYIESKLLLGEFSSDDFKPELIAECKKIAIRLSGNTGNSEGAQQARAAEFLREDFRDINAAIQSVASDFQDVLAQRMSEIEAILTKAPLAAVLLIGSTLEGLLLDTAMAHPAEFVAAKSAPTAKGKVLRLEDWRLYSLIDVAYELKYVTKNVKEFSHSLRDFRNYIHPREQASAGFNPNADTAKICFQVLKASVSELALSK